MSEALKNHPKIAAVDFDGTIVKLVEHPHLRLDFDLKPNAKEVLLWMKQHFFLILWTCRTDQVLRNAVNFLNKHGLTFDTVNENAPFLDFNTSGKIYADCYIDDKSISGTIDWLKVKEELIEKFLKSVDCEKVVQEVIIEVVQ
jgi:hypothetical protein